jgi:DNA-binding transcriptional MerR regulator
MSESWTIGELAERATDVLRAASGTAVNGRVREVPGERLIRWYTTIGLVDPPLTRRGRIALYGNRHLLQLVAVKRLQAAGRSIADIQADLAGATDARLAATAGLPAPEAGTPEPQPARGRFWADPPRTPAEPTHTPEPTDTAGPTHSPGPAQTAGPRHIPGPAHTPGPAHIAGPLHTPGPTYTPEPTPTTGIRAAGPTHAPGPVHGVRLAPGVMIVLDGASRTPSPDDVAALLAAAGPLLAVLGERGLTEGTTP